MCTRSQSRNQNHPQQQAPPVVVEPFNLEEPIDNPPVVNMAANGAGGAGPPPAGGGGLPVPDLRTMEELCQPSLDGRGGPIAPIAIQATTFGLKNDMIQQVQNSCPFRGPGDDANKHFDKFLHVTQSMTPFVYISSLTPCKIVPPNAVGGTFMKRRPKECYDLIKNTTAHHNDWDTSAQRNESSSSITSSNPEIASLKLQMEEMNRNLTRVLQTNQQVNTVTPSCETCGGPHSYNDCPATVGQNQNVYAVGAYNQGGHSYQPQGNRNLLSYRSNNYLRPPGFNVNQNQNRSNQNQNNQVQPYQNRNQGNNQSNNQGRNQFFQGANHNQNQVQNYQAPNTQPPVALPQELTNYIRINENKINSMQTQMNNLATSNQRLESMLGNFIKMNTASTSGMRSLPSNTVANPKGELKAITTRSGLVLDGPTVPMPPPFINPEEDERVEETLMDPEHAVILKKLPKKLGDPGKFLIPCGFSELKCKALADLGIARDVFVLVGKFTFPADFVIVDYESDPCVPLILVRPFLWTARALIDVHIEEMILCDDNERLILNMRHDTSSYSNEPKKESINMIDVYNVSHEEYREDLFATNHQSGNPTFSSHTDLTSAEVINPSSGNPTPISEPETKSSSSSPTLTSIEESDLIWEEFEAYLASDSFLPGNSNPSSPLPIFHNSLSGSTTSSSPNLPISETSDYSLEEFADELAHITFLPRNDDLPFDAESDLRELEYLLNHDPIKEMDSILEDSVDENSPDDNLDDTISEMFTDKHAFDYSSPPLWDDYDDELFDLETVNDNTYDDPFDFEEEKIKESKLLINELDLPKSSDFLPFPERDSLFYEDFSKVDALPSTNNEDKVFNPGILIHKNHFEVTNLATPDKNVKKITNASLILEDLDPPVSLYELPFHKEVPGLGALLSFSSENKEKV
ncbi:hypothetical protein Tco_0337628, partial [Tanacetum coccineum]